MEQQQQEQWKSQHRSAVSRLPPLLPLSLSNLHDTRGSMHADAEAAAAFSRDNPDFANSTAGPSSTDGSHRASIPMRRISPSSAASAVPFSRVRNHLNHKSSLASGSYSHTASASHVSSSSHGSQPLGSSVNQVQSAVQYTDATVNQNASAAAFTTSTATTTTTNANANANANANSITSTTATPTATAKRISWIDRLIYKIKRLFSRKRRHKSIWTARSASTAASPAFVDYDPMPARFAPSDVKQPSPLHNHTSEFVYVHSPTSNDAQRCSNLAIITQPQSCSTDAQDRHEGSVKTVLCEDSHRLAGTASEIHESNQHTDAPSDSLASPLSLCTPSEISTNGLSNAMLNLAIFNNGSVQSMSFASSEDVFSQRYADRSLQAIPSASSTQQFPPLQYLHQQSTQSSVPLKKMKRISDSGSVVTIKTASDDELPYLRYYFQRQDGTKEGAHAFEQLFEFDHASVYSVIVVDGSDGSDGSDGMEHYGDHECAETE